MEGLSEEVLFIIFGFLNTVDVLTISCVNKRFHRIAMDPRLHRSVSFKGSWNIPGKDISKHIKKFKASLECLDLEDCYWIKTADLRSSLLVCENLKQLNVLGCNVTPDTFSHLLYNNDDLTEVKWTFQKEPWNHNILEPHAIIKRSKQQLKSLHLRVDFQYDQTHLIEFANQHLCEFSLWQICPSRIFLQESVGSSICFLRVYFQRNAALPGQQSHFQSIANNVHNYLNSTHDVFSKDIMKKEHLLVNYETNETANIAAVTSVVNCNSLKYLSVTRHAMLTSNILEDIAAGCSSLETLNLKGCWRCLSPVDGIKVVLDVCQNLRHLNLGYIPCHEEDSREMFLLALASLKKLSSLALTVRTVLSEEKPTKEPHDSGLVFNGSCKRKGRISHGEKVGARPFQHSNNPKPSTASNISQDKSTGVTTEVTEEPFQLLTKSCQNMEEFELINEDFRSLFGQEKSRRTQKNCPVLSAAPLVNIANWKALRKLTLAGLNVRGSAQFLTSIVQGCPELERLSLAHLSQLEHSGGVASLNNALRYSHNLKDFRLEQPYFNISSQFLSSLGNAVKLERLCIIAKDGTFAPFKAALLFKQCHQLICFQVMCDITKASINRFRKSIERRFGKARPALSVWMEPYHRSASVVCVPECVPWVHLQDLTVFHSNVATTFH